MDTKIKREVDLGAYRELMVRIGSKRLYTPNKAIEHRPGASNSPFRYANRLHKTPAPIELVDYRIYIKPRALEEFKQNIDYVYTVFKDVRLFETKPVVLASPYFVLSNGGAPVEEHFELLANMYATILGNHRFRNNILMLPGLMYERGRKANVSIFTKYISDLLNVLAEYGVSGGKNMIGYIPNSIKSDELLRNILASYIENEIFHFSIDIYGGDSYSLANRAFLLRVIRLLRNFIEKELDIVPYIHILNVNAKGKDDTFPAKDFLSSFLSISTFSFDTLPKGGGTDKNIIPYKKFDTNDFNYHKLRIRRGYQNKLKAENGILMVDEFRRMRKMGDKDIGQYISSKSGFRSLQQDIIDFSKEMNQSTLL